ncbi:hypothetical protein SAMN05216224_102699 [Thioclava dalianensis]|nr:hypothetical protein SAMN05216224_102699 [Thioclava dalianensis]
MMKAHTLPPLPYETGSTASRCSRKRTLDGSFPHGWWIGPGVIGGAAVWTALIWWALQ